MTPARLRWGLIFIQIGILVLLRNMEVLNDNFWFELIVLSPVVLIAIGIEKIFTQTRLQFIAYATPVLLFLGGFVIAFTAGGGGSNENFFSESVYILEDDPAVKRVKVDMKLYDTDLTIRDSGPELVYGRFDKFTRKPNIEYVLENDVAKLSLVGRKHNYLGGAIKVDLDEAQDWYMRFSNDIPLELTCNAKRSDIHLNLATTPLTDLKLISKEAKVYLKLGDLEPFLRVFIEGEDSRVRVRIPVDIGLRVTGDGYKAYLEKIGLVESDNGFINANFEEADSKIELELDDKLSSFTLDYF